MGEQRLTDKFQKYEKEFRGLSECLGKNTWYSASIAEVLGEQYDPAVQWDDTLEFMDVLIDLFERHKPVDDLIILQARFGLTGSQELETALPTIEEAKAQCPGSGSLCAFPCHIATILNRLPFYQQSVWHHSTKYHSMKLFTYYRCSHAQKDEGHPEHETGEYRREIVRFYSQKWTMGNSPGFLLP